MSSDRTTLGQVAKATREDWGLFFATLGRIVLVAILSIGVVGIGVWAEHRILWRGTDGWLTILGAKCVSAVFFACGITLGNTLFSFIRSSPRNLIRVWILGLVWSLAVFWPRVEPFWLGITLQAAGLATWFGLVFVLRRRWGKDWGRGLDQGEIDRV